MTCELCGESLPFHDVFNHMRVMHPDVWDEQMPNSPVEIHVNVNSPRGGALDGKQLAKLVKESISRSGRCHL